MPFYEYKCQSCGRDFELFQKMGTTEAETQCPHCNSNSVKRKLSSFSSPGSQKSDTGGSTPTFSGGC